MASDPEEAETALPLRRSLCWLPLL